MALAWYRQAVQQARVLSDPPFDPPVDYLPGVPLRQRRREWRRGRHYPAVDAAWWWLFEMLRRVVKGKPPVTEVEFQSLAVWFHAHEAQLGEYEHLFALDTGRQTSVGYLRYRLAQGPRVVGATEVVEDLQQIQTRYADQQSPGSPQASVR